MAAGVQLLIRQLQTMLALFNSQNKPLDNADE